MSTNLTTTSAPDPHPVPDWHRRCVRRMDDHYYGSVPTPWSKKPLTYLEMARLARALATEGYPCRR
jgi:hypothetical protein